MTPFPAVPTPPPEPESVEALLIERDSLGVLNDLLRAELRESEQARAGLAARVRELARANVAPDLPSTRSEAARKSSERAARRVKAQGVTG